MKEIIEEAFKLSEGISKLKAERDMFKEALEIIAKGEVKDPQDYAKAVVGFGHLVLSVKEGDTIPD